MDAQVTATEHDYANDVRYRSVVSNPDRFTAARYAEGMRWRHVFDHYLPANARIIDVGAGDGAIEMALAAGGYRVVSIDALWNENARLLGVRRVIADAALLPFRSGVFDAAISLETLEHLADVRAAARDLTRTLRQNALVLITTPPRWRFALQPDPHFAIRFLTLMPMRVQRRVAAARHEFIDRIYSSVPQIARAMRPLLLAEIYTRSRMPRRWFWDALVFRK